MTDTTDGVQHTKPCKVCKHIFVIRLIDEIGYSFIRCDNCGHSTNKQPNSELAWNEWNATNANDKQIDGTHYKDLHIQPWEIIERNNLNFWEGNAIKYILRWRKKAGVNDLKKAIHYLEKQIEIEENKQ